MGPAQQRLGADAGAGVERDLGLVVQLELALGVERVLEVGEQAEGAAVRLVALVVEPGPAGARAAAVLRRREGGAQVLARAAAAERLQADADAGVDRHVVAEDRLAEALDDPAIIAGAVGLGMAGQAEGEAQEVDVVDRGAGSEDLDQPRGAGADEGVRAGMPEHAQDLVERLGVGEGDEDERGAGVAPEGGVGLELPAVGQRGDRIEPRRILRAAPPAAIPAMPPTPPSGTPPLPAAALAGRSHRGQ